MEGQDSFSLVAMMEKGWREEGIQGPAYPPPVPVFGSSRGWLQLRSYLWVLHDVPVLFCFEWLMFSLAGTHFSLQKFQVVPGQGY